VAVTSVIDRSGVAVDHHSPVDLDELGISLEDCGLRMFEPHKVEAGMGFEVSYVLLGSKREEVRLAGHAVTPPLPSMIVPRLMEVLDG
jgi:DNA (cytosine-5)-methyltransferase 1